MRRGEIWWAQLDAPAGPRPVLLLSRDESYAVRDFVIMSPLTTNRRGLPTEVEVGPEEGLPRPSVVNLDVLTMESKRRLRERISALSPGKLREVDDALRFALGMT
jgi:mRNA interferase MazF